MAVAHIRGKGQVTIPREVREKSHLEEGDPVEFLITPDGSILLRPKKLVDATQAWFWSQAWQAGEAEATADIAAGRVTTYKTGEDFLASLEDD